MTNVFIAAARRTAIGAFMGGLSSVPADQLGSHVLKKIINDTKIDPAKINEVIMGQVLTGGSGQNPARQALIGADIPEEIPAYTINKVCGSGLQAVVIAAQTIKAGDADMILAGGQENMSFAQHGSYIRKATRLGDTNLTDYLMYDGLTDVFSGKLMGVTAENIAKRYKISRQEQDRFALESQLKAAKAQQDGVFKDEIIPVEVKHKKETKIIDQDEGIRGDSTIEGLKKLRPAFDPEGSVTAGNSSTINDGAAALLVVSERALKEHNLEPICRIASYGMAGVDPMFMGTGPVPASENALKKAGWKIDDLDLIEANEAFAVQALYVNKNMKWDTSKVNISGGAIALGHPIGASGARVLTTLVHGMKRGQHKKGLATLCIGGGMGIAMCVEDTR